MTTDLHTIATPALVIDRSIVQRNLARLAAYCREHGLGLRPHTKTHKSRLVARMQMALGAVGLTVAKVGEAEVMAEAADDLLLAYPAVDAARCGRLANLAASGKTVRVGVDSNYAADALAAAGRSQGSTIGLLVDLDVGYGRTGVQTVEESLALAQHIDGLRGVRLDGIMIYPGHIGSPPDEQGDELRAVDEKVAAALELWRSKGLDAAIVSGGSTPSAFQSHLIPHQTEIRPGTYVFNDMNTALRGYCSLADCAARFAATVVSDAVPGQVVIDAGSKTLSSDLNAFDRTLGFGHIVEYPDARITRLSEEHGQVDISRCDRRPAIGERVTVIPNHICVCVNLQTRVWWREEGERLEEVNVDARGMLS